MVASQRTPWPTMARPGPNGTKPDSRVTRFPRGVENTPGPAAVSCVPDAELGWPHWAWQPLGLVRDGRVVGRGWVARRLHVV